MENKIKLTINDIYPFGKWKGVSVKDMLDENNLSGLSFFGKGDGYSYLCWVKEKCSNISLDTSIIKKMEKIKSKRDKVRNYSIEYQENKFPNRSNKKCRTYDHYNDIGSMTDISFQDLYGDFGH